MKKLATSMALWLLAFGAVICGAVAADLPCGTARLIVPWPPGGDTDIIYRSVVDAANKAGAKPSLQVVNSAGQGGTKGAREVKDAKPDGCTLLALHDSTYTSFLTGRVDFTYDVFEPVALMTYTPSIIGAAINAPFSDMKGLIAEAKKAPQTVIAGATLGSNTHFIFLILEDKTGMRLKYVPYEGTRERLTALLAKNIQLGEMNIITARQYMKEGTLKGLGIATEKRDPALPELATLKEQGVDLVYGTNRGVVAPKGTPATAIAHWEAVLAKAARDPAVVATMEGQGTIVQFKGARDYAAHFKKGFDEHKTAAVNLGIYKQ